MQKTSQKMPKIPKKQKQQKQKPKDGLARLNFLYQASLLYSHSNYQFITTNQLIKTREKLVARLDRSVKQTLCKKCHSILTPLTCKIAYKEFMEITCNLCLNVKRLKIIEPNGMEEALVDANGTTMQEDVTLDDTIQEEGNGTRRTS